jgi:hypothetical protein
VTRLRSLPSSLPRGPSQKLGPLPFWDPKSILINLPQPIQARCRGRIPAPILPLARGTVFTFTGTRSSSKGLPDPNLDRANPSIGMHRFWRLKSKPVNLPQPNQARCQGGIAASILSLARGAAPPFTGARSRAQGLPDPNLDQPNPSIRLWVSEVIMQPASAGVIQIGSLQPRNNDETGIVRSADTRFRAPWLSPVGHYQQAPHPGQVAAPSRMPRRADPNLDQGPACIDETRSTARGGEGRSGAGHPIQIWIARFQPEGGVMT